jgi:hypothetical protein
MNILAFSIRLYINNFNLNSYKASVTFNIQHKDSEFGQFSGDLKWVSTEVRVATWGTRLCRYLQEQLDITNDFLRGYTYKK